MRILVINPGSTTTKIAIYDDEKPVLLRTIVHRPEELAQFATIADQRTFRRDIILSELRRLGVPFRFDAIIGRGGLARPVAGGVYEVNERMCVDMYNARRQHVCNLGCIIAYELGGQLPGCRVFMADPVVVDEMEEVARVSGSPLMPREPVWHALNQRAIARRFARECGRRYEELNLIVCHMGGGVSIGAHMKGSVVDTQNALDGEGPFSPERSGSLPTGQLVKQCFSGKYTEGEMHRMLSGRGGLVAYTGSNDMRYLLAQAEHDKKIAGVVDAFHYQIGKEIGAMAAVMHGKVDQIILTGGIAYGKETVDAISEMVGWIAPITVSYTHLTLPTNSRV